MFPFSIRSVFYVFVLTGTLSLLTCIEQDNPWDPINGCHPDDIQYFSNAYNSQLQKVLDRLDTINATFASDTSAFTTLRNNNDSIRSNNTTVTADIQEELSVSQENHLRNIAAGDCETATPRDSIRLQLQRLNPNVSTDDITQAITKRSADSLRIETIFRETEGLCGDLQIFTTTHRQSILKNYTTPVDWIAKKETITRYSAATVDSNRIIDSLNEVVRVYNSRVVPYNDSLDNCKIGRITDPDSIRVRLDSIQPGDTLAIGEGVFSTQIYLDTKSGEANRPIVILGTPDGKTIFKQSNRIEVSNSHFIRFEYITFQKMKNSIGMRLINECSNIQIEHCTFRDNDKYGLDILKASNISIGNCIFTNNGAKDTAGTPPDTLLAQAGIRIQQNTNANFFNVLICNNTSFGIDITDTQIDLVRATVSDNLIDGIRFNSNDQQIHYFNSTLSIYSYNGRYGIFCNNESSTIKVPEINNRFYFNTVAELGGDSVSSAIPVISNIDPQYADKENGNYRIGTASLLFGEGIGYQYP